MSAEKVAPVPVWFEAEDLFSERERAALARAETVTRVAGTHIPDEAFQAAKSQFSGKELADLTIAIGLMNAYNRLAIGFRMASYGDTRCPLQADESRAVGGSCLCSHFTSP